MMAYRIRLSIMCVSNSGRDGNEFRPEPVRWSVFLLRAKLAFMGSVEARDSRKPSPRRSSSWT
jgi:hypothetical protein